MVFAWIQGESKSQTESSHNYYRFMLIERSIRISRKKYGSIGKVAWINHYITQAQDKEEVYEGRTAQPLFVEIYSIDYRAC